MTSSQSSKIHQVLLESTHEVLGSTHSHGLEPGERTFLAELERLLFEQFGTLTGKGMAIRMGRSGFQTGLRRWGESLGFYTLEYRLLPFNRRVRVGLEQIARFLEEEASFHVIVSDDPDHWVIEIEKDSRSAGDLSPVTCSLLTGVFQEFMQWAGSGRFFTVRETACVNQGAPCCRYEISRKPLE